MRFIPISYGTDMVQANHARRKNQTRRLKGLEVINREPDQWDFDEIVDGFALFVSGLEHKKIKCPYGQPGDVLWVREACLDGNDYACWGEEEEAEHGRFAYRADCSADQIKELTWRPSIHMPIEACRSWCVVEAIEAQRLRDISPEDAIGEGIDIAFYALEEDGGFPVYRDYCLPEILQQHEGKPFPRDSYFMLFIKINGPDMEKLNPWLWVVRYRHTTTPPDGWLDYMGEVIDRRYFRAQKKLGLR